MKAYSKKQAGVIFSNYKRGNLTLTDAQVKHLYDYADAYSMYFKSFEIDMINAVREAVQAVFDGNLEEAQVKMDRFESIWNLNFVAA